jgi:hypothetical protein
MPSNAAGIRRKAKNGMFGPGQRCPKADIQASIESIEQSCCGPEPDIGDNVA